LFGDRSLRQLLARSLRSPAVCTTYIAPLIAAAGWVHHFHDISVADGFASLEPVAVAASAICQPAFSSSHIRLPESLDGINRTDGFKYGRRRAEHCRLPHRFRIAGVPFRYRLAGR